MTKMTNEIQALRQASIDAAVELDWTVSELANVSKEQSERISRIVKRIFDACEALDAANQT
jgi:hypothetical protein